MKRIITGLCYFLLSGVCFLQVHAQLQSEVNFTVDQQSQIEKRAKEYAEQGLDIKRARMQAEKDVAPDVVKLRVGDDGWLSTGSSARPDLTPWPLTHTAWRASAPYPGSIQVDRDSFIHTYKPSDLVKKILLKAYTPEDEQRIRNVRFLGFAGIAGGGDAWNDTNPNLAGYGVGNRGLAYFNKGTSSFSISKGLLLSTGPTWDHEGPNELDNAISDGVIEDGITLGNSVWSNTFDDDLEEIAQQPVSLGAILEFDFCPAIDKATFEYVFGSEEYPEYVHSSYNDVFGFFVTGPFDNPGGSATVGLPAVWDKGSAIYKGQQVATYNRFNIAHLPNGMPVGVDWTNWGYRMTNTAAIWSTPYAPNTTAPWDTVGLGALLAANPAWENLHATGSTLGFNPQYHQAVPIGNPMMELDGITTVLTAVADSLIPGKWYRLKLAISQVDWQHGDGVFLGNLNLGQGTAGIESDYVGKYWPAAYDSLALDALYSDCVQTLKIEFDPQGVTQFIEIIPMGAAVDNVVTPDGKSMSLKDSLKVGAALISRSFKLKDNPSFANGSEGFFITVSREGDGTEIARDTTEVFKFYKRFATKPEYIRPTTGYSGRLDLNIKDGSPLLFRSLNGGLSWENAHQPFTKSQIANLGDEGTILLKEPNSCWYSTVSVAVAEGGTAIMRQVTIPNVEGIVTYPVAGQHTVPSRGNFVFTLKPTRAQAGMIPVVTTNRVIIPDQEGVLIEKNVDGTYTVTIIGVQEPINLNISYVLGKEDLKDIQVWSEQGRILVASNYSGKVSIFSVNGTLISTELYVSGETKSISLPAGFYVVSLNENTYKMVVK